MMPGMGRVYRDWSGIWRGIWFVRTGCSMGCQQSTGITITHSFTWISSRNHHRHSINTLSLSTSNHRRKSRLWPSSCMFEHVIHVHDLNKTATVFCDKLQPLSLLYMYMLVCWRHMICANLRIISLLSWQKCIRILVLTVFWSFSGLLFFLFSRSGIRYLPGFFQNFTTAYEPWSKVK